VITSRQALDDNARATTDGDASFLPEVGKILNSLLAEGRMTLLDAGAVSLTGPGISIPMLGDDIQFFFSRGHSEGQMHAVFSTIFGAIVFGGDFWPTVWHAQDPSRFMPQFDRRDLPALLRDKESFLPRAAAYQVYLYFYHDPEVAAAQVVENAGQYEIKNPLQEVRWSSDS